MVMTPDTVKRTRSLGFLVSVACIILIIGALRLAESFLIPVMMAFFLAQLSLPVTKALRARRVPLWLAVGLTVVISITLITGILMMTINLIGEFRAEVAGWARELRGLAETWGAHLEERGLKGAEEVLPGLFNPQATAVVRLVNQVDLLGRAASLASTTFFVVILMVFMLLEGGGFGGRIQAIHRLRGPNFAHLHRVSDDIQKYLGVKTLVSAVTGTLAGVLTWALGLEFPVLWGLVAFLLNYIPAIGSVIAAIPPILVALVQFDGPWRSVLVLIGYLAINMTLGNVIEPMLLGQRFGLSTLVVLLSVLFWGWLWGPIGMFLAVPLTMLVKVVFDNSADFRWLSVAMGKGATDEEAARPPPDLEITGDAHFANPDHAGDVVPTSASAGVGDPRG